MNIWPSLSWLTDGGQTSLGLYFGAHCLVHIAGTKSESWWAVGSVASCLLLADDVVFLALWSDDLQLQHLSVWDQVPIRNRLDCRFLWEWVTAQRVFIMIWGGSTSECDASWWGPKGKIKFLRVFFVSSLTLSCRSRALWRPCLYARQQTHWSVQMTAGGRCWRSDSVNLLLIRNDCSKWKTCRRIKNLKNRKTKTNRAYMLNTQK